MTDWIITQKREKTAGKAEEYDVFYIHEKGTAPASLAITALTKSGADNTLRSMIGLQAEVTPEVEHVEEWRTTVTQKPGR